MNQQKLPSLLSRSRGHAPRVRQLKPLVPVTPGQVNLLSVAMKYAVALVAVSTATLVLLTAYGVVQEVQLKRLATHKAATVEAVEVKEETILSTKKQVTQMRLAMETTRTKTKELEKRRGEIENSKKEAEEKLQTCNSEKARAAFTFPGYPVRLWIHSQHSLTNALSFWLGK